MSKPKCQHKPLIKSYLAAHMDADERIKRKEQQRQCPVCNRWIWKSDYFKPKPALISLAKCDEKQLCVLKKDHVNCGPWTLSVDPWTVYIADKGYPVTTCIELPRNVFNKLVAGYLKPRKAVRK